MFTLWQHSELTSHSTLFLLLELSQNSRVKQMNHELQQTGQQTMLSTMTNEKESGGTDEAIPHHNASAWDTYEKHELLGQGQFGE